MRETPYREAMVRPADDNRLVWIDLELVVGDEAGDLDDQLELVDPGIDVVVHQPPDVLDRMDDFVRTMHTKSGLIKEIEASTIDLTTAGRQVLDYIRGHVPAAGTTPLCGNSIGTDRRFLAEHLREIDDYLHYRSIDVSSLKELCRRWYPEAYKNKPAKSEQHRALDDIKESVAELRYYRETILKPPE